MFQDRAEAGRRLAAALAHLKTRRPVVLALPRGGVAVGCEIAEALGAPLDLVLARKIGVPWQPELALGAIVDGDDPQLILDEHMQAVLQVPQDYVEEESRAQLAEIDRRRALYLDGRPPLELRGRTAIVVDDGIATGATVRAALRALKRRDPAHTVLAVPVAPEETIEKLRREVDEIVCLEMPDDMAAIGYFYRDFHQLDDEEVTALLDRVAARA